MPSAVRREAPLARTRRRSGATDEACGCLSLNCGTQQSSLAHDLLTGMIGHVEERESKRRQIGANRMCLNDIPEITRLSVPERILLLEDLWDSIAAEPGTFLCPKVIAPSWTGDLPNTKRTRVDCSRWTTCGARSRRSDEPRRRLDRWRTRRRRVPSTTSDPDD
jgi:hypothetical protein